MLKFKSIFLFNSIVFLILVSGCKTTQLDTVSIKKHLPTMFSKDSDTVSNQPQKWQLIFFNSDLKNLIDTALKNNFDLRMALQKIEMYKAGLTLNKGIRLPEVGANASIGQRKFGDYTMDGVGNYDTQFSPNINDKQQIPNPLPDYYVGFAASWEIDLWGKLKNKKKAAAARFIASQHGRDLIITNLISEIASNYFRLLALDNEAKILADNIELQQAALDLVIAQKEAGKSNELAVEMMKAQLLSSKVIQTEVEQLILETESTINFLCGTYPKSVNRDTSYFSQHLTTTINTGIPSDLLKNRPDIKQAEAELNASNADVKSAQAAFYPSLSINSAMGLQAFNSLLLLETPASLAYNLAGGLTAPLINRRRLKSELLAAKAEQKQAYINYEKTVTNSFSEVYVALKNIKNIKTMYDLKKEEVDILKKSIATSGELYKAGRANYLEVITSQKNALQSQLELINLYNRQNIALVDLYRSIGGGWNN
ncbi:MAG: TolC family protein [Bacteroidetes bacterium]|nr:TolC family protein [Bacteroidota bacterium]